jgi:hypothetical protein
MDVEERKIIIFQGQNTFYSPGIPRTDKEMSKNNIINRVCRESNQMDGTRAGEITDVKRNRGKKNAGPDK